MAQHLSRRQFLRSAGILTATVPILKLPFFTGYRGNETDHDSAICVKKFAFAVDNQLNGKPVGDVVASIGESFIGTDYEAGVLDTMETERLVVHLTGLDCVTLCENALAFARCIKLGQTTFDGFRRQLQLIRYRGGTIDGYPSRLHYFSDWIFDNQIKGTVINITAGVGGAAVESTQRTIDFMTSHRSSYRQLADDASFEALQRQEKKISGRPFRYIPKDAVRSISENIHNGDIIAVTTDIPGLDVSHTGIAVRSADGVLHLLHAPVPGTSVRITDSDLHEYLAKNRKQTGIIVAHPVEP